MRVWGLVTDDDAGGKVWLHRGFGHNARREGRRCKPAEMIDPAGRRLILIISDCMAAPWYTGQVSQLLTMWADHSVVTIIQILPEWLWARSALRLATSALVCAASVPVSSKQFQYKLREPWWSDIPSQNAVAIPVVTLEAPPMAKWAQMLTGDTKTWVPARLFEPGETPLMAEGYSKHIRKLSPRDRVRNFLATASPLAGKLAALLAASPPLRLWVMRLVQQEMLPESQQVHLAELLTSGLLRVETSNAELNDPNEVDYEFVDEKIRDHLLEKVPRGIAFKVLTRVSRFINLEIGKPGGMPSLIEDSQSIDDLQIGACSTPFAAIATRVLRRLGGHYARLANQLERRARDAEIEQLQKELDNSETSNLRRLQIGERMFRIGDIRLGVGVRDDGLPEIVWCRVPGGTVTLEANGESVQVEPFDIAKYPLTHIQYRSFLEAEDGYQNRRWFDESACPHKELGTQHWKQEDNCPAENVSWYDAMAFCNWLSARLGFEIRLPTEWEWQQAATGGEPRNVYPWGPDWDPTRANMGKSRLNRTTAVGMYPLGASPPGALDMSGNVWEWCINEYNNPKETRFCGSENPAVRGGSWRNILIVARTTSRFSFPPDFRDHALGFRLVRGYTFPTLEN